MLAICLTAASTWPRKAAHDCFHVFAWYRTKSDRHVLCSMLLTPEKKSYRPPTARYRQKIWNTYFNEKSKVTILTYIHMISYEYEYFGSARTPVTKSSTRDHGTSLFCFIQDRRIPRSLQRWVSLKSSISQLTCFYFIIIAIEKPYTTARILENKQWVLSLPTAVCCGWQPQHQ